MRSRALVILLVLSGVFAAGPSFAKPFDIKAKGRFIPPPPPAVETGLRGPLDATKAKLKTPGTEASLVSDASPEPSPSPGPASAVLSIAALKPPPAITPLKPVGDQAPICRAGCAETRYTCATTDDTECDSKWSQCVANCSIPASR